MNLMASKRPRLIYGIALPLAVAVGYLLATPLEVTSLAVMLALAFALCIPILLRWHHVLLIFSWNAALTVAFLPGRPTLWMAMSALGFGLAVVNRIMGKSTWHFQAPAVTGALLVLAAVVVVTAKAAGGLGLYSFGNANYGGKGYFYILLAIIGYFALTSQSIPVERAPLCLALFFLPGLSAIVGQVTYFLGPSANFLSLFFPGAQEAAEVQADIYRSTGMIRLGGITAACVSAYYFLLARHGIRGIFTISSPVRLVLIVLLMAGSMAGGFRSLFALVMLVFIIQFYLEGLLRTVLFPVLLSAAVILLAVLVPLADKLPLSVQRTLSILPVAINPVVRNDAENSAQWRFQMWNELLPDLPKYVIMGKGYSIDPDEMYMTNESVRRGLLPEWRNSMLVGDYHSGPLSLYVPFGSLGVIAFVLFLVAATRALYFNYRYGDPALARINTLLLSLFIARIILFFLIFGAISSDLYYFTGIIGLSVSLNGGVKKPPGPEPISM